MTTPHTATVKRKTKTGTKYTFGTNGTVKGFLQPINDREAQVWGLTFGQGFKFYTEYNSDVQEHDKLVIDSENYGVKGIAPNNYGTIKHKKVILERV